MSDTCRVVDRCRICASRSLERVLDLGVTPLANASVDPGQAHSPELRFPLDVDRCLDFGLAKLSLVCYHNERVLHGACARHRRAALRRIFAYLRRYLQAERFAAPSRRANPGLNIVGERSGGSGT